MPFVNFWKLSYKAERLFSKLSSTSFSTNNIN
jgi:hypothetical protein